MSWSPAYVMQLAARGKRPVGTPEDALREALGRLSAMDVEAALHHGASARAFPAIHGALDAAVRLREPLLLNSRLDAVLRTLIRHGAALNAVDPRTRQTVAERVLGLGTPGAVRWALAHLQRPLADPTQPPALVQLLAHGSPEAIAAFPTQHPQWLRQTAAGVSLRELAASATSSRPTQRPRR